MPPLVHHVTTKKAQPTPCTRSRRSFVDRTSSPNPQRSPSLSKSSGPCFTKNLTTNRNRISYISRLSYAYDLPGTASWLWSKRSMQSTVNEATYSRNNAINKWQFDDKNISLLLVASIV